MTTVVIEAFGTRGDVAPLTGLGAGLKSRLGAHVVIAAQQTYQAMVTDASLEFRQLPHDTESETRSSTFGQGLVDGARMRPDKNALAEMRDQLSGVGEAMAAAAHDADLVLFEGPVGSLLSAHVAEALEVDSALVHLQPATPTGTFAPPALGTRSFGGLGNRLVWRLAASGAKVFDPLVDGLRAELGLPTKTRKALRRSMNSWSTLYGFSEAVLPAPADWPANTHICGYWWPTEAAFTPEPELVAFLDAGEPPVFVGLGSTATAHGESVSAIVVEALRSSGRRGIVQRGWANLDAGSSDDILTIDDVPHSWLFPRVGAAIHHCGAGTTAATLRAGIPTIPVPGIMDQPFWAERLHRLGVASNPLPRHSLSADGLTAALSDLTEQHEIRSKEIAARLATEDGIRAAASVVERLLNSDSNVLR
ncbi:glycosyltransferase [Gordonia sp. CPCC 205333]|uniref:glycosyltransferase n=1 Tax=Gordonia sp. CPCC 205333 TaxID=3140790 RepID=UPI003AF3F5AD